jgi:hypothetical protein
LLALSFLLTLWRLILTTSRSDFRPSCRRKVRRNRNQHLCHHRYKSSSKCRIELDLREILQGIGHGLGRTGNTTAGSGLTLTVSVAMGFAVLLMDATAVVVWS